MDQQPQPAPQPQMTPPAPAPMQPTPMQPAPAPGMPPTGSGMNKKLILSIVGGVVALLVILIGIVVAVTLGSVSQKDYKDAADVINDMRTSYSKTTGVYLSTYSTETEIKNGVEKMQEGSKEFDEDYAKLAELKAIKNDPEVNELYKKLDEKKPKFDMAIDVQVEAYEKITPVAQKANDVSGVSSVSSAISKLEDMKKELEDLDLKHEVNKDYIDELVSWLDEFIPIVKKYAEGRADYKKYDSSVSSKYFDLSTKGSDIDRDWRSNLEKVIDDGQIRDEMNELIEEINAKQLGR